MGKKFGIVILVLLMMNSSLVVFADTDINYTFHEVYVKAIENIDQIETIEDTLEDLEDVEKVIRKYEKYDIFNVYYATASQRNREEMLFKSLETNHLKMYENFFMIDILNKNLKDIKNQTKLGLEQLTNGISTIDDQIVYYEQLLDLSNRKLSMMETQHELGMLPQSEIDKFKNDIESINLGLKKLDINKKKILLNINKLTGFELSEYFTITENAYYKIPYDATDIDELAESAMANNSDLDLILLEKENIKKRMYYVNVLENQFTDHDVAFYRMKLTEIDRTIESKEYEIKETLLTFLNEEDQLEDDIKLLELKNEELQKVYGELKLNYDLGKAIELQLVSAEIDIFKNEITIAQRRSEMYTKRHKIYQYLNLGI